MEIVEEKRGAGGERKVQEGVEAMAIDGDSTSSTGGGGGNENGSRGRQRKVTLHFENMGCILGGKFSQEEEQESMLTTLEDGTSVLDIGGGGTNINGATGTTNSQARKQLEEDLSRPFALPSPAREALLSVALLLLSKKEHLSSVSNTALFPGSSDDKNNNKDDDRWLLILNWRSLLRMLLRTAPYLDEHKAGTPPMNSSSRQSTVLKRTVNLIRSSRRFFDQGIRPPGWIMKSGGGDTTTFLAATPDATARAVWNTVKNDVLYHTHSNSCFRGLILLYLFHPSKCSSAFYLEVMPDWMESWRSVDRCPEFDFLWMVMFGRARKHVHPGKYDWGSLRRHLLTQAGYW